MKKSWSNLSIALGALCTFSAHAVQENESVQSANTVVLDTERQENGDREENRKPPEKRVDSRRSPQGIDEDVESRRNQALNRPGRERFEERNRNGREVRSYDGTSNNREHSSWGATFSHLQRLAPANYTDGVSAMAGSHLKSARQISNLLVTQAEGEDIPNQYQTSDYLWQWGQFIDHDIGLTDGSTAEQENIIVPEGDVFFDSDATGDVVIPFNRAIYDPDSGTNRRNVREQENEISSWIDGSMIYGSDSLRNEALRVGPDSPFLKTSENNLLPFNTLELPNANGFIREPSRLFLAGDVRVNEQAGLTAMHTLWVREHNRIAALLQTERPEAPADAIYEMTRRLVIAEIQIITYNEYLPALLGDRTMPEYKGYDRDVNPTIYNEFSAAAYRLGHSEVSDTILRLNADGSEFEAGHLPLRAAFFSGIEMFKEEQDIEPILRGMANQKHQAIDTQVVNGLRNFLFGIPGAGGFDLISLNIQRGRDHGLSSYNETRRAMDLRPARTFADITTNTNLQIGLFNAYSSIDDVELWIGGLAEEPDVESGSQLGELFTKINVKQFDELRAGDRFWYEHYLTKEEKQRVASITLADVIRNNTAISEEIQDHVFYVEAID